VGPYLDARTRARAYTAVLEAHDAHRLAQLRAERYVDRFSFHGTTLHDFVNALGGAFKSPAFRIYALRAHEERVASALVLAAEARAVRLTRGRPQ